MKYIASLLSVFIACGSVWAAPEAMTIYATLSAPIASFWEVETKDKNNQVQLPANSVFNMGFVEKGGANGSAGGTITLKGKADKPMSVEKLRMEKGTTLSVGNRWFVDTLVVAPAGTIDVDGKMLINDLQLQTEDVHFTQVENLHTNSTLKVTNGTITNIDAGGFIYSDSGSGTASWTNVNCSEKEPGCSHAARLLQR